MNNTPIHALCELSQWETEGRAHGRLDNPNECFVVLWANLMHTRGLDFTDDTTKINAFRLQALEAFQRGYMGGLQGMKR
jgi:hypothetical protein